MKTVKNKQVLVAADIAGADLKNAVVAHLEKNGWEVTDVGVKTSQCENPEMFHRIGFRVGAMIAEGEFERALLFCGTAWESTLPRANAQASMLQCAKACLAALRCITGNNCNVLSMGGHYVAPATGIAMAEAFLNHNMGDGYEHIENWYEFHKLAYDEIEAFDYEEYKKNGFKVKPLGEVPHPAG